MTKRAHECRRCGWRCSLEPAHEYPDIPVTIDDCMDGDRSDCPFRVHLVTRQLSMPAVHMKGIGVKRSDSYKAGRADDPSMESLKEAANEVADRDGQRRV
jgi:predicted nucleic acid-binding Zn ribbon protein